MVSKKSQVNPLGVLFAGAMLVITFIISLPILGEALDIGKSSTNSSVLKILYDMFPFVMGITILLAIIGFFVFRGGSWIKNYLQEYLCSYSY